MTIISIKEYYAAQGSRYSDKDASILGPALSELAVKGEVQPRDVVDVAKSSNSPLHKYFEWNDARAADQFRLEQARNMLRSIKVKYTENGAERVGRAFVVTTKAGDPGQKRYSEFIVLHGDSAVAVHMMRNALKELASWKNRYEQHQTDWEKLSTAFHGVFNQVAEMEDVASLDECVPSGTEAALVDLRAWSEKHGHVRDMWGETVSQLRYLHEAICEAERIFQFVEKKHVRRCMTCSGEFVSDGPGNRLCNQCRAKSVVDEYAP